MRVVREHDSIMSIYSAHYEYGLHQLVLAELRFLLHLMHQANLASLSPCECGSPRAWQNNRCTSRVNHKHQTMCPVIDRRKVNTASLKAFYRTIILESAKVPYERSVLSTHSLNWLCIRFDNSSQPGQPLLQPFACQRTSGLS